MTPVTPSGPNHQCIAYYSPPLHIQDRSPLTMAFDADGVSGYIEELECLQAIYADTPYTLQADAHTEAHLSITFTSFPVLLSFKIPPFYPQESPTDVCVDSLGIGMSRLQLFEMQLRLASVIQSKQGEPVLFDLTDEVCGFAASIRGDIDDAVEDNISDEEEVDDYECPDNRLDYTTAMNYMGSKSIASIMDELGPSIKLMHAEVVLRRDLRQRFNDQRRHLQWKTAQHLRSRRARDAAADDMSKIDVVYHGTLRRHIGSIVRSGFVVPGRKTKDGETVEVRCGSTWGKGIYTSPDPSYSLSYTDTTCRERRRIPGQKLIVCAALLGKRRHCERGRGVDMNAMADFDSVISPSKLEYIIFNPAQLLPLFVLHIASADSSDWKSPLPQDILSPRQYSAMYEPSGRVSASEKERRRLLTSQARKHLPHGFGPRGNNFVVEEIGEVDDDEELWGEYQDTGTMDEFQTSRQ